MKKYYIPETELQDISTHGYLCGVGEGSLQNGGVYDPNNPFNNGNAPARKLYL